MTKKNKTENPYAEKILFFLQKKRSKSYKSKEISKALQVKKNDYYLFRDALQFLMRLGKIVRLKTRRYSLPSDLQKISGKIQLTRKGFGFVADERTGEEIFIPAQHLNTALDNDTVEVQLFAVSRGKRKEGQIVEIRRRARQSFVGTYHHSEYYGFMVPDNPKVYRDFYIPAQNGLGAQDGQKVVVKFLKWDTASLNPEGRITEILGFPDEPGVDVISVVKGFELPTDFPKMVLAQAEKVEFQLTPELVSKRLDLRKEMIFTIDPVDAKDFDDAVSLKLRENGNYLLGVHIADVSFFVPEGSAVDKEALRRGMSVYLVDRVIPMLPEKLSNELCSLQPNEPRLTLSCIMEINKQGNLLTYEIKPSIIWSKRRFSYEEAQSIIENPESKDSHCQILREMRDFSQMLRQKRLENGSIEFETPEVRFVLDKQGKPVEIKPVERLQSHELIEEFMLIANKTVAEHIQSKSTERLKLPFLYRIHERPDSEKIANFEVFLNALGFSMKIPRKITPKKFQEIMNQVLGTKDDVLIEEVALRSMMKANYSSNNIGHFGLAFQNYTHFTSPIRRYPDLTVHRLLKKYEKSIELKMMKETKSYLKKVGEICSDRERIALEAERESVKIKQVEWIADHIGENFTGLISGVTSNGLFVEIIPYLIDGFVKIQDMEDDYYLYDEKTFSLVGKEFGRLYRLGAEIKIQVKAVNLEINQVDFIIIEG